jgi:uncharacterized membrane protein
MVILVGLAAWWSSYYGNHQIVSVAIRFLHLAALLLGGGTGLFADRQVLGALRAGNQEREEVLATLKRVHAHVVSWIVLVGFTGLLMTAADTTTFLPSKLFWCKMTLVALLLLNGAVMILVERRARRLRATASSWPPLAIVSAISALLWLAALFLGTWLTVAA